jgi:Regulator of chromosome condensation (RCC1) repeat
MSVGFAIGARFFSSRFFFPCLWCQQQLSTKENMLPAIVLAWGYAEDGQTGVVETDYTKRSSITTEGLRDLILGDRADYVSTPVPIAFPTRTSIMQVSAGSRHSLAVDTAGVPYAWGWNKVRGLILALARP